MASLEATLPADSGNGTGAGAHELAAAAASEDEEEALLGDFPAGLTPSPKSFASLFTDEEEDEVAEVDPSLLLVNCGLSDKTVSALEARGITSLFPIQKVVFEPAMRGADLVARAKTGSGAPAAAGRGGGRGAASASLLCCTQDQRAHSRSRLRGLPPTHHLSSVPPPLITRRRQDAGLCHPCD